MNETATALNLIYTQYGDEFFQDKSQLKQTVKDSLKNNDVSMLTLAINQNVATMLINTVSSVEDYDAITAIIDELVSKYMWQRDVATIAVNYFVQAKFGSAYTPIAYEPATSAIAEILHDKNKFLIIDSRLIRYKGKQEHVTIPAGVTTICERAFYNCHTVQTITISASVTTIEDEAFVNCGNLTIIDIPKNVTSLGAKAFKDCVNLTTATISTGITAINDETFYKCINLTTVDLAPSITSIGAHAFYNCTNLIDITIPTKIQTIANAAFKNCKNLKSISICAGAVSIGDSAFCECSNLITAEILEGVTSVGTAIFEKCTQLEYIVIPATLTEIHYTKTEFTQTSIQKFHRDATKMQVLLPIDSFWKFFV